MSFNFCGNENVVSLLDSILKNQKFSHAYLFYGEDGVGKKTIARQFAQAIFCKNDLKQEKNWKIPCFASAGKS